jgi:predicted dehydrogenase
MVEASPGPRMRLLGLGGTYEIDGLDSQEEALAAGVRPGEGEWGRTPPGAWGRLGDGIGTRPVETEPGDYPAFYAGVARSLRDGVPPPVDPRDSVAGLEIIEAARAAAAA